MHRNPHGFSLIEVLVVISIFTTLATLAMYVSFSSIGRTSLKSETNDLVLLLTKARSNAMSTIDARSWGVCVLGTSLVLFSGSSYATRSHEESLAAHSTIAGMDCGGGIVFAQLSGNTIDTNITVSLGGKATTISINHEGRIETN